MIIVQDLTIAPKVVAFGDLGIGDLFVFEADLCMRVVDNVDQGRCVVIESSTYRSGTILDIRHFTKVDRVIGEMTVEDRD